MTTVNRPQSASSNRCKMIGLIAGGVLAATAGLAAGGETTAGSIKELSASNGSATAAEDFAFLLGARPGCYVFLGNGASAPVHTPEYDFDDDALPWGASYWVTLVERRLAAT